MQKKVPVTLVPLDHGSIETVRRLSNSLSEVLGLDPRVRKGGAVVPREAFNPMRRQHNASSIVSSFEGSEAGFLLLVTDLDLYTSGLNFCFGLAHRLTAIISLHRLRPEFYGETRDHSLLLRRAEKEAVHEICHLIGLRHCRDPLCVMHFSNQIGETDIKRKWPCKACLEKIKSRVT